MRYKHSFPKLKSQAVLSPMVGVTDVAFRAVSMKYGAGMTYTEFVSCAGLVRGNAGPQRQIQTSPDEKPVAVQLFGSTPQDVIEAGKIVQDKFDVIDINCGCPAWKVIKTGAGSEMLRHPEKIASFVNKLVTDLNKPVTVKIRAGIDSKLINAVEVSKLIEDAGASAIAIHGRTQKQGYRGVSDWDVIKQVKEAVNIPVIGNGDVFTPESYAKRLDESGVDAIMIARGAIGNPYIFKQMEDFRKHGSYDQKDTIELFGEYLHEASKYDVEFAAIKRHALSFTKGMTGGARVRDRLSKCLSVDELRSVLEL